MTPFPIPLTTPPDTRIYFVMTVDGNRGRDGEDNAASPVQHDKKFVALLFLTSKGPRPSVAVYLPSLHKQLK